MLLLSRRPFYRILPVVSECLVSECHGRAIPEEAHKVPTKLAIGVISRFA
jgi:hypothetical protein